MKCKHLWSETKQLFKSSKLHQKKKSFFLNTGPVYIIPKQWLIQEKIQYFQDV